MSIKTWADPWSFSAMQLGVGLPLVVLVLVVSFGLIDCLVLFCYLEVDCLYVVVLPGDLGSGGDDFVVGVEIVECVVYR